MTVDLVAFLRERLDEDEQAARVLADVAAKRRILAEYVRWVGRNSGTGYPDGVDAGHEYGLEYAVRCLALPYAGHPDYREEWAPDD